MTAEQVQHIVLEIFEKVGLNISKLIAFKPTMKTKEVVKYLKCDRHWLYDNKERFGGRIINRRGDYEFDTEKVVNYKIKR